MSDTLMNLLVLGLYVFLFFVALLAENVASSLEVNRQWQRRL